MDKLQTFGERPNSTIQKEILGEKESFFSVDRKFDKEALAKLQVEAIKI